MQNSLYLYLALAEQVVGHTRQSRSQIRFYQWKVWEKYTFFLVEIRDRGLQWWFCIKSNRVEIMSSF